MRTIPQCSERKWWQNPDLWSNPGTGGSSRVELDAFARILDECQHRMPAEPTQIPLALPLTRIESRVPLLPPPHIEQWVIVRGDGVTHVCDIQDIPRTRKRKRKLYSNGLLVEVIRS